MCSQRFGIEVCSQGFGIEGFQCINVYFMCFQGFGIEGFHCIFYMFSGIWNRGVPMCSQGFEIEGFHCVFYVLSGIWFNCIYFMCESNINRTQQSHAWTQFLLPSTNYITFQSPFSCYEDLSDYHYTYHTYPCVPSQQNQTSEE